MASRSANDSILQLPFRDQLRIISRNLIPIMSMLIKTSPTLLSLKLILLIVQAILPGLGVYFNKLSVDLLTQVATGNTAVINKALVFILLVSCMGFVGMGLSLAAGLTEQHLNTRFSQKIETMVAQKALRLPLIVFETPEYYDRMQRARQGSGQRAISTVNAFWQIISQLLTIGTFVVVVSMASVWLSLALIPVVAVALMLHMYWGRQRYQLSRAQTHNQRDMGYVYSTLTAGETAKEVRLFDLGGYLLQRWEDLYTLVRDQNLRLFWRQSGSNLLNQLFTFFTSTGALLFLFFGLSRGEVTLGTYVAVLGAFAGAIGIMSQVAGSISQVYEYGLYTNDLLEYLALPERSQVGGGRPFPGRLRTGITVEGLTFTYPGTNQPALKSVSFKIRAGETVAIVGENGSGKTTLAKCLLGFYDPGAGTIQFDGTNIEQIDRKDFYKNVTAVFQDFARFMLTFRENVGFGDLSRIGDLAALERTAQQTDIQQVIRAHANGWDTRLGRMWEGGAELSYGQWQRIAIARALFRDAQVIALDEPTASLDPKIEASLFEQFSRMAQGRTSFMISHRLGMARAADRILVMKNGELVEDGTHEQLLQLDGEYARMFRLQAKWYVESTSAEELPVAAGND